MQEKECLCGVCPPCVRAWREVAKEIGDLNPTVPDEKSDIVEQILAEIRKKPRRRARPVTDGEPKTHCDEGHALKGENRGMSKNGNGYMYPYCKCCKAKKERERQQMKRAKSA